MILQKHGFFGYITSGGNCKNVSMEEFIKDINDSKKIYIFIEKHDVCVFLKGLSQNDIDDIYKHRAIKLSTFIQVMSIIDKDLINYYNIYRRCYYGEVCGNEITSDELSN